MSAKRVGAGSDGPGALAGWLDGVRVVVCLGPGGVGKTTTAASVAIAAAIAGRRTAVLTVDPAARLKDALDLPERPGSLHRVPLPDGAKGTLDAVLLDAKGLFDGLVRRLAPTHDLAERILANPVYRNVAGAFAGSDAYMSLEQVLDLAAGSDHDLVVVDTPPASHALELFDAPQKVLALLQSRALEYLEDPTRILGNATSRIARGVLSGVVMALERMTGLTLMRDLSALASDFSEVAPRFRERAASIRDLLHAPTTRYALVTAPDPHGADDVLAFAGEVDRLGIRCDAVVVNRVLALDTAPSSARRPGGRAGQAAKAGPEIPVALSRRLVECATDLAAIAEGQRRVVTRLREGLDDLDLARGGTAPRLWLELPALRPAPVTLAEITDLARRLDSIRAAAGERRASRGDR
ncbi:MAG: ArsA family ATPase [Alphaproteobacteria bacterium]